jgi:hypothetical protein
MCLETEPGSSFLIYAADIIANSITVTSGDKILTGGMVFSAGGFFADGDITVEKGIKAKFSSFTLQSTMADVILAAKVRVLLRTASILAAGDITFGEKVSLATGFGTDGDIDIVADGIVEMTRPKIKTNADGSAIVVIQGSNVLMHEGLSLRAKATASPQNVYITATSGDVTIDRLLLNTRFPTTISGTNVTIGVMQDGTVPRSRMSMYFFPIEILATDEIHIDNLRLRSPQNVRIETDGTTLNVLNSDFVGTTTLMPVFTVRANGAGSTCDLTGTEITKATLVTDCDTVIGP